MTTGYPPSITHTMKMSVINKETGFTKKYSKWKKDSNNINKKIKSRIKSKKDSKK